MPNIKSLQQARAELPGSTVQAGKVADPIVNRMAGLSGSLVQRQRVGSVTKTGKAIVFSPTFSGTPHVFLRAITAWPGSFVPSMTTLHSSGGTIAVSQTGTQPVSVIAWDPTR